MLYFRVESLLTWSHMEFISDGIGDSIEYSGVLFYSGQTLYHTNSYCQLASIT